MHENAFPSELFEVAVFLPNFYIYVVIDPHMAKAMDCGFCHMVARFQGQEERERESGRGHIALYMSHKASSHWLGQLQVQLSSRGGNCVTPPLDGEACSRHPMNMWCGTYIGGTISRENIICHGGLAGNTGNDKHWVILYNIILSHMVCNG